jgi:hypothetical protein
MFRAITTAVFMALWYILVLLQSVQHRNSNVPLGEAAGYTENWTQEIMMGVMVLGVVLIWAPWKLFRRSER